MRAKTDNRTRSGRRTGDELHAAMARIRPHLFLGGVLSLAINVLYLAAPLYMLQVYDRVLSSSSVLTLVFVTMILLAALATLAALDTTRSRLLVLAGEVLDHALAGRLFGCMLAADDHRERGRGGILREFDSLRSFFSGSGVQVMLDAPWTPVFVLVCALLHPLIGLLALLGAVGLLALTFVSERRQRAAIAVAHDAATHAYANAEHALQGADSVAALGMRRRIVARWRDDRFNFVTASADAGRRAAGFSGVGKFLRMALQSGALGLGAYLAVKGEMTPGAMIAGSVLVGRALAPLDQVFGAWRSAGLAHGAYRRIRKALSSAGREEKGVRLPDPAGNVAIEGVVAAAPGSEAPILRDVSFFIARGECLGVVGPSGSGKSTLARVLAGAWRPRRGVVRLDGADISQLDDEDLGRHLGYLPQDAHLFSGSVADNISRFERFAPEADMSRIEADLIEAAQAADAHRMILALPEGYETEVGPGGSGLSGGQRQRIALARALYRRPTLLVLDEPNSHLDSDGERTLMDVIADCKRRGCSVVVVAHRASILSQADSLILLRNGVIVDEGRRDDVIRRLQGVPHLASVKGGAAG